MKRYLFLIGIVCSSKKGARKRSACPWVNKPTLPILLPSQAVIRGQQQSRWLRSFLSANRRRIVNIYLEDDQQLDQVYLYLNELYTTAVATAPCLTELKSIERVPFVLDVLLPEVS